MCFSATANFVGSAALGAIGVVTLTKVKHRREMLFAALPVLFALWVNTHGGVLAGLAVLTVTALAAAILIGALGDTDDPSGVRRTDDR